MHSSSLLSGGMQRCAVLPPGLPLAVPRCRASASAPRGHDAAALVESAVAASPSLAPWRRRSGRRHVVAHARRQAQQEQEEQQQEDGGEDDEEQDAGSSVVSQEDVERFERIAQSLMARSARVAEPGVCALACLHSTVVQPQWKRRRGTPFLACAAACRGGGGGGRGGRRGGGRRRRRRPAALWGLPRAGGRSSGQAPGPGEQGPWARSRRRRRRARLCHSAQPAARQAPA